mgnify:CR=1 FL=1
MSEYDTDISKGHLKFEHIEFLYKLIDILKPTDLLVYKEVNPHDVQEGIAATKSFFNKCST